MKNLITTIAILATTFTTFGQLKGSGTVVTKNFNFQNFNKVTFNDFDGKLEIEVGKTFSISVIIDDNLVNLLTVNENAVEKKLTLDLKGNRKNKMYIEDTKISVKITMPELQEICNNGNANLLITNINSKNLKSMNPENGSTTLEGIADYLEVINSGNGTLNAKNLSVNEALIQASGNGNAYVNVAKKISAKTSGNCTVANIGNAKFDANSKLSGNSNFKNL